MLGPSDMLGALNEVISLFILFIFSDDLFARESVEIT